MLPVYEWSESVQADIWAHFNRLPYCLPIQYVSHQFDHNNSIQDCDRGLTKVKGTVADQWETFSVVCLVCLRRLQDKINAMITNWRLRNWWRMESCVSGTFFLCLNSPCFIQNIPIFSRESFDDKLIDELVYDELTCLWPWGGAPANLAGIKECQRKTGEQFLPVQDFKTFGWALSQTEDPSFSRPAVELRTDW